LRIDDSLKLKLKTRKDVTKKKYKKGCNQKINKKGI
jgi:hypothetical protein